MYNFIFKEQHFYHTVFDFGQVWFNYWGLKVHFKPSASVVHLDFP